MYFGLQFRDYWIQLYNVSDSGKIQNVHTIYADGVSCGSFSIEMQKYIGTITYKTLSTTLKQLEADGLVHRKEYPQIPPKVEYSLTEAGKSLIPILDQMCEWGDIHRK